MNDDISRSAVSVSSVRIVRGGREIYSDFSFEAAARSVTMILGASGSGKTTLLDAIAGLLPVSGGNISFGSPTDRCPSCLFQEPRLLPWLTLFQNVALPLKNVLPHAEATDRALLFLEQVGLADRRNDRPPNLSGGEKQRTAIARAFAFPSSLLLMDEAFQSQDLTLKIQLMELLRSLLRREPRTVIAVTHDIREALFLGTRAVVIGGCPVRICLDIPLAATPPEKKYTDIADPETEISILEALA